MTMILPMLFGSMITMPNAWTVLKENSSLVSGTAWEHLNNQEGGGGTVIVEGMAIELQEALAIEVLEEIFEVEVLTPEYIIEVD